MWGWGRRGQGLGRQAGGGDRGGEHLVLRASVSIIMMAPSATDAAL